MLGGSDDGWPRLNRIDGATGAGLSFKNRPPGKSSHGLFWLWAKDFRDSKGLKIGLENGGQEK
jgi:hypothetical protein